MRKINVRLTQVFGDQEEFADLIGRNGVLTLGDRNVFNPNEGGWGWLTLDKKRIIEKDGKITVSTKLGNKFVFKVLTPTVTA